MVTRRCPIEDYSYVIAADVVDVRHYAVLPDPSVERAIVIPALRNGLYAQSPRTENITPKKWL